MIGRGAAPRESADRCEELLGRNRGGVVLERVVAPDRWEILVIS